MPTPTIALCVGHSRKINQRLDGGALSADGTTEHTFNTQLATRIARHLTTLGISSTLYTDYSGTGYGSAMAWLGKQIDLARATLAIELHFNSSDTHRATGHEWLHFHTSKNGALLADHLRRTVGAAFPFLPDRGLKPISKGGRGYEFLRSTSCPAVICEPFFGDNPTDWQAITPHTEKLAQALATGLAATLTAGIGTPT